jgi:alkylation response protein AidB-like acyl-CoA dehydrogenase
MAIDFTLTAEQKEIQASARDFAENVLGPIAPQIDAEPDPYKGFQMAKPAYEEACRRGIAFSMLPKEYGGAGCRTSTSSSPPRRSRRWIPASAPPCWSTGWA